MINGKRIAVVLPAYNAEKTLEATVRELPDLVDIRILVDDHSSDRTVEVANRLGLQVFRARPQLRLWPQSADLLSRSPRRRRRRRHHGPSRLSIHAAARHRDGQHDRLWRLRRGPGLPHHRRHSAARRHAILQIFANRLLTAFENTLSRREALRISHRIPRLQPRGPQRELPLRENSDDFVFDNQMLAQCVISASAWEKFPVPPNISPKLPRLIFAEVCSMAWACC